ncbi:MAG: hypothetical protein HZB23_00805 [Deltaproteobacteria bacterium]|nr:hypothetical protein [Deltaproteobacteria bacterium]
MNTSEAAVMDAPRTGNADPAPALFIATTLDSWETDKPRYFARDVGVCGVRFRRLDPEYYAWLRHKMECARKAAQSGRLPALAFDELRTRFNEIHAWAMKHLGEASLLAAVKSLDPKDYAPPENGSFYPVSEDSTFTRRSAHIQREPAAPPYMFPKDGDWPNHHLVPPSAVAKVDAVRDRALSLGWSEARLYRNRGRFRFPLGEDYGLVCFLEENQRIGEVTRRYIEIIGPPPRKNVLRFHNPDVDQPWLKKSEAKQ